MNLDCRHSAASGTRPQPQCCCPFSFPHPRNPRNKMRRERGSIFGLAKSQPGTASLKGERCKSGFACAAGSTCRRQVDLQCPLVSADACPWHCRTCPAASLHVLNGCPIPRFEVRSPPSSCLRRPCRRPPLRFEFSLPFAALLRQLAKWRQIEVLENGRSGYLITL